MATERDLELLDDYLSGKMDADASASFENRIKGDSELQKAHDFQSQLVSSIRQARINELKAMLNNAPVPAISSGSTLLKLSAGLLIAAATAFGVYYLLTPATDNQPVQSTDSAPQQAEPGPSESNHQDDALANSTEPDSADEPAIDESSEPHEQPTVRRKSSPVAKPEVNPYDPTEETETSSQPDEIVLSEADESTGTVVSSSVEVEIDATSRKLDFHYQFRDNKLILFGSFEKDLYTILEFFHENKRTVFLSYNSAYYLLDESKSKPTPLKSVTDPALLKKLQEFSGK